MVSIEMLERERAFHNGLVASEMSRAAQDKYYRGIADCFTHYEDRRQALAAGGVALEYGCSHGMAVRRVGEVARQSYGIDISDASIRAARVGAAANCHYAVADAHHTQFADNQFDLVYGSGIIHHLDVEDSFREIRRILRPGGKALFMEPLAGNPLFDLYRLLTPGARTPDEHPLVPRDIQKAGWFFEVEETRYGLASLLAVPAPALYRPLAALDRVILRGPAGALAWYIVLELTAPV